MKIHLSCFEFEFKPIVADFNSDSKALSNKLPIIATSVQVFSFNWLTNHPLIGEQIENKLER